MNLTLFSISGLVLTITCLILIGILSKNRKSLTTRLWIFFNIAVAIWGISAFFIGKQIEPQKALLWLRIGHIGVIFIPIFLYHFIYILCKLKKRNEL